jgi:pantetheine-phosphate adenylyltransferase
MSASIERVGLYPGTFDPMTNGHLDIISRAVKLVDRLVIGVAINEAKGPMFNLGERVQMLEEVTGGLSGGGQAVIEVKPFDNLLVQFAEQLGAQVIIRGLRAVSDFEYEYQMVGMNSVLSPSIETIFLMAEAKHQAVSSSLVKEIAKLGGDVTSFIPPFIEKKMKAKFDNQ